jgi:N-acetylglucosaminyldiphosphoundecaprenol N-acetyl-beta-D-mannosaminyltransferase
MAKLIVPAGKSVPGGGATRPATASSDTAASGLYPVHRRVCVGALPLDPLTLDEAVVWVLRYIGSRGNRPPARICCPNAALVWLAETDPGFADLVASSNVVVADGLPLLWAASFLGTPLAGQVRGVDLMERICAAGAAAGMSFYILGGLPEAAEIAAARLMKSYPGVQLAGVDCPPIGFDRDPVMSQRVREKIVTAAPDFLIVALGSPKQEWWIAKNYRDLPVGAIHGVGAAVDTYAGLRSRPPIWMRNIGLEWLGRLLAEPQRLWRRYIFGNSHFLFIVFRQWLRKRRSPGNGREGS